MSLGIVYIWQYHVDTYLGMWEAYRNAWDISEVAKYYEECPIPVSKYESF